MAILSSYISASEVKPLHRVRYSSTSPNYFVQWANQLIEELQDRGFLTSSIKETGTIVKNGVWIGIPSDFVSLEKIFMPINPNGELRVELVNDNFKLMDYVFDSNTTYLTAGAFANSAVGSIAAYLSDNAAEAADAFKGYLLYLTAGTKAGLSIILSGNAASVLDVSNNYYTTLNYLFPLASALAMGGCTPDITGVELVPPQDYVIIRYNALISKVTAVGDEVPLPDDCEVRLVPTWLRWCCEKEALSTSKETIYWKGLVDELLDGIQAKRSSLVNQAKGRRLVGFEKTGRFFKGQPSYQDCYNADA